MKTNQPSWHCIANLGDASPEDHGGAFVLVDKRGIYTPELWLCEPGERENSGAQWSTVLLEQLTPCPNAKENLGDNRFHPESPAWFGEAKDLESIAGTSGLSPFELRELLTSSYPIERAAGYQAVIAYYGAFEFDQSPDTLTRRETVARCRKLSRQIAAASNWKDGI